MVGYIGLSLLSLMMFHFYILDMAFELEPLGLLYSLCHMQCWVIGFIAILVKPFVSYADPCLNLARKVIIELPHILFYLAIYH